MIFQIYRTYREQHTSLALLKVAQQAAETQAKTKYGARFDDRCSRRRSPRLFVDDDAQHKFRHNYTTCIKQPLSTSTELFGQADQGREQATDSEGKDSFKQDRRGYST